MSLQQTRIIDIDSIRKKYNALEWPDRSVSGWHRSDPEWFRPVETEKRVDPLIRGFSGRPTDLPDPKAFRDLVSANVERAEFRSELLSLAYADVIFLLPVTGRESGGTDCTIRLENGERRVHVVCPAASGSSANIRLSVELSGGLPAVFGVTAQAGEGASLNLTLAVDGGILGTLLCTNTLTADRDASIRWTELQLGGARVKSRTSLYLHGERSEAVLRGIVTAGSGAHMDVGTVQVHEKGPSVSRALYKHAVSPGGRSIYQGMIEVLPEASGTDAYLSNRNLLLGEGARADSIPNLVIRNNDVRCSHGSATGKIDKDQLFYLMSRGYSRGDAAAGIVGGFLGEALDGAAGVGSVRRKLDARISDLLSAGGVPS